MDDKFEELARRITIKKQVEKQGRVFNQIDPSYSMDNDLHSFVSNHEDITIQRDKNGFIDFEKTYNH